MNFNLLRVVVAGLIVAALSTVTNLTAPQASPPGGTPPTIPPQILIKRPAFRFGRTLNNVSENEYIYCSVGIDTNNKRVKFRWDARKAGAALAEQFKEEAVSFWPTALCRSRVDARSFYIAGRSTAGPVIEHWTFNADETLASHTHVGGMVVTDFNRPTITRTAVTVPSALGNVADITAVTPAMGLSSGEELWVMEWESRNVYAVSSAVSGLQIRVPASIGVLYRSINGRTHSTFGSVVIFDRKPWQLSKLDWSAHVSNDPTLDPDRVVAQDADQDGTMENSFIIPKAQYGTHALYTTGTFTDD